MVGGGCRYVDTIYGMTVGRKDGAKSDDDAGVVSAQSRRAAGVKLVRRKKTKGHERS